MGFPLDILCVFLDTYTRRSDGLSTVANKTEKGHLLGEDLRTRKKKLRGVTTCYLGLLLLVVVMVVWTPIIHR